MLTLTEYAKKRGLSRQRIHKLLKEKRIPGAKKLRIPWARGGFVWMIPRGAKIA